MIGILRWICKVHYNINSLKQWTELTGKIFIKYRIGQKKIVNVYRLITKNTLEEKIMNLQQFKLKVSSSIINRENKSFKTMDTDDLIDLFKFGEENNEKNKKEKKTTNYNKLQELWSEQQYDEYNQFIEVFSNNEKNIDNKIDTDNIDTNNIK
jgi:hypothetical protein